MATLCIWAAVEPTKKLQIGQVLTSDEDLADELGVSRLTIFRKLKILVENGFITLARDGGRGRIVSVSHVVQPCYKSRTARDTAHDTSQPLVQQGLRSNHEQLVIQDVNNKRTHIEEREKEKREGEGEPRPFNKSLIEEGNGESVIGNGQLEVGNGQIASTPGGLTQLGEAWYGTAKKRLPGSELDVSGFHRTLEAYHKDYTLEELTAIHELTQTPGSKVGKDFITPMDGKNQFFGTGRTLIQEAYNQVLYSKPKEKPPTDIYSKQADLNKKHSQRSEQYKTAIEDPDLIKFLEDRKNARQEAH